VIPPVEGQRQPSDLLGHLLCAAGLGSLSLVLIEGPAMGWLSAPMLIGMACAAMALSGFAWRIQLAKHPVIPKALCATPGFVALNLVGFLINLAVYGQLLLLSLYLLQSQRADPLQAGWLLMPMMLAFATGSFASASVSARVGRSRALAGGLALAALTALVLAVAHGLSTGMVALAVLVMNCAIGVAIPAMTASTMALSSRLHANSAAASLNAVRQTGALVGVAVAGWVVHLTPGWPERLAANFWTAAVCFGLACVVEMRRHY
jgi:DHA2 family methylenomycin A resistance protein-like MFS transporter